MERILKTVRGKSQITYKSKPIKIIARSLNRNKPKREYTEVF
jgi:hypothetical protein